MSIHKLNKSVDHIDGFATLVFDSYYKFALRAKIDNSNSNSNSNDNNKKPATEAQYRTFYKCEQAEIAVVVSLQAHKNSRIV